MVRVMRDIPRWPRLLGLAGLLPQFACLAAALFGPEEWKNTAAGIAAIYAGLVFTFLGGAWWGIAAGAPAAERRSGLAWLWIAAVLPSLIAFGCLGAWAGGMLPLEPVLIMLGAGFWIALGVDSRIGALGPRWWMRLRAPLSIALGGATMLIAMV